MPRYMYQGTKSDSGYVSWKPCCNDKSVDFPAIENELGFELHEDLKEYLTSAFFLRLQGAFDGVVVSLTPITPLVDIGVFLNKRVELARKAGRDVQLVEIGNASIGGADSLLLLFDNRTGGIMSLDVEKDIFKLITPSIITLISTMEPRL